MFNTVLAAAGILLIGSIAPALADQHFNASDSAAKVNENASPMGVERAERNSNGGDREHGQFGQEQSTFVRTFAGPDKGSYGKNVASPFAKKDRE